MSISIRIQNRLVAARGVLGVLLLGCGATWLMAAAEPASEKSEASATVPEKPAAPSTANKTQFIGRTVPNFVLPDSQGKPTGLGDFADKQVVAIVVLGTACPISNLYLTDLINAQEKHGDVLQIIGLNANASVSHAEIAKHVQEYKLNFPVLCDAEQAVADLLGATRTAEVFVLDSRRTIRYHGHIDDRYRYTTRKAEASRNDAALAVREILAGKPVSVAETEFEGCLISRAKSSAPGAVTYYEHIAPLLQEKCQDCHHPGTAAPFSLLSYEDAVDWAAMIKEVVQTQRMPPWHADPRYGHFENSRALTTQQTRQLLAWVDAGTPAGDPQQGPAPKSFQKGWRIDQPDVVFKLPETVSVPATGVMPYKYFVTPTNFDEDMWIEQAEARPGDLGVVHHIIVFASDANSRRPVQERNWLIAFAPGSEPLRLPAGIGRKLPKGANLIWQMHYTPNGKAATDQSEVAFKFCKTPPTRESRVHGIDNHRFQIPPGHANYAVTSRYTLDFPVTLLGMMPHMHVRGKSFSYIAQLPDGTRETLLSVPQFDFNWQSTYKLAEPRLLPKGTRIECLAHYDNSAANPANPNPNETVRWGDQTFEEMMIGYLEYIPEVGRSR